MQPTTDENGRIAEADEALSACKRGGRNRVHAFGADPN